MKRHTFSLTIALTMLLLWAVIAGPQHATVRAQDVAQPSPRPTLTPIPPVEQPTTAPVQQPVAAPPRDEGPQPTPVPTRRPALSVGLTAMSPVVPTTMVQPDGSISTPQDQPVTQREPGQLAANPNPPIINAPSSDVRAFWRTTPFALLMLSVTALAGLAVFRRRAAR